MHGTTKPIFQKAFCVICFELIRLFTQCNIHYYSHQLSLLNWRIVTLVLRIVVFVKRPLTVWAADWTVQLIWIQTHSWYVLSRQGFWYPLLNLKSYVKYMYQNTKCLTHWHILTEVSILPTLLKTRPSPKNSNRSLNFNNTRPIRSKLCNKLSRKKQGFTFRTTSGIVTLSCCMI